MDGSIGSGADAYVSSTGTVTKGCSAAVLEEGSKLLVNWGDQSPQSVPAGTFSHGSSQSAALAQSQANVTDDAMRVTAHADTGRGELIWTCTTAPYVIDSTALSNDQTGSDDDIIKFYVYIPEPGLVKSISVDIDVYLMIRPTVMFLRHLRKIIILIHLKLGKLLATRTKQRSSGQRI